MIVRFDSVGLTNIGDVDFQGFTITVDLLSPPSTLGYRIYIDNIGDTRIVTGDYLYQENGLKKVITAAQYAANATLKRLVTREIGEDLMEAIIQGFIDLAATDAQKIAILRHIGPCQDMIIANKINASLVIANALPTTTEFTTARKNGYIALIQAAVNKL